MERPLAPIQITQKKACFNNITRPWAQTTKNVRVVRFSVWLIEVFISLFFLFRIWLIQVTVKVALEIFLLQLLFQPFLQTQLLFWQQIKVTIILILALPNSISNTGKRCCRSKDQRRSR